MARIRTIKPEFWTNERVMECSTNARLMFIGMWNFADDLGRLTLAPKTLKAQIFPSDDFNSQSILGMVAELIANGLVLKYEVDGREYLQIVGWQHQRIDKPQPGKCPGPVNGYSKNDPGMVATEGKGEERKVEEKKETRASALSSHDFDAFWLSWPNKVGKPAAQKAFSAAMKRGATIDEVLFGIESYIRDKPPDRPWLNPATFLNQDRWKDRPAAVGAPNGQSGQISAASSKLVENLKRGFGGAAPEEHLGGGEDAIAPRLLSYGPGQ